MPRIVMSLVLLCVLVTPVKAQTSSAMRLQRIVSAVHTHEWRAPVARPSIAGGLLIDLRALNTGSEPLLRKQLRFPIDDRIDFTLAGRIGRYGPSSQARLRIRF